MKNSEVKKRLFAIGEMIDDHCNSNNPMLSATHSFLERIQSIAFGIEEDVSIYNINPIFDNCITISCDASIIKNPEETTSIGYLINFNDPKQVNISSARFSRATTTNQAQYDAIYFSLTTLFDLSSGINISKPINVISDNLLVISQLNGEKKCKDEKLKHKRDTILQLIQQVDNISVIFSWKPRDSTPDLIEANNMAQNLLGVKNH